MSPDEYARFFLLLQVAGGATLVAGVVVFLVLLW